MPSPRVVTPCAAGPDASPRAAGSAAAPRAADLHAASPTLARPDAAPVRERDTDLLEDVRADTPWDVIVWDDPVNLMSYVVFVFRRVFGYPEAVARKLMLEVHEQGRSLVASEPREQAERYVEQLHGYGLQATMERS